MTVTTTLNYKQYQADGIAKTFAIPFLLLNRNDLLVYLDNQLITTGYTVTGLGNPIGSISFNQAPTGVLLLQRSITLLRDTDYQENGDLLADTLNRDFDRLYLALQGFLQSTKQTLRVSDAGGVNELPLSSYRANKLLGFGADGQPTLTSITSGSALELAQSLADTSDPSKGSGIVGYSDNLIYLNGTVGSGLNTANKGISTLKTKTETLTTKVTALEKSQGQGQFIIIYPNGGTKEKPASVVLGGRYVMDNPFPEHVVNCRAEIFYPSPEYPSGAWGDPNIMVFTNYFGMRATQLNCNEIVLQVARSGSRASSGGTGDPFGNETSPTSTVYPTRIIVWRVS